MDPWRLNRSYFMLWKKPSGLEIETNDLKGVKEYCESLNWVLVPEKRKRRTKQEMEADKSQPQNESVIPEDKDLVTKPAEKTKILHEHRH